MANESQRNMRRRDFLAAAAAAGAAGLWWPRGLGAAGAGAPTHNPAASLKLAWTDEIKWGTVVDITAVAGPDWAERLARAQALVAGQGGGVVYFPPGDYRFADSIQLLSGVVLRGAEPSPVTRAQDDKYAPPTRFEFPKYEAANEGEGTPILRAFKGVYLAEPASASNCGLVNIAFERGHVRFGEGEEHQCGRNRLVFGCVFRNCAVADAAVPDTKIGQHAWQRFTNRFGAAIDVKTAQNALVANNRVPKSGEANFTMNGYVLRAGGKNPPKAVDGIVFDYDNRPGIYVNHFNIGGAGGQGPDGTPETHPYGFRQGIVIRDNYLYHTGRCAIGFCGDGVRCENNVIRFAPDEWRPTNTGRDLTSGSATNDNRAMEMRGWRWVVSGNDYVVHRNWAFDKKYRINDGEGLMHEDHANSTVKDSVLTNNRGNTYLSIYKTAGIDGLLVEGNEIRLGDGQQTIAGGAAIFVSANRTNDPFPCRNVRILNNTVAGGGILISGVPGENNVVKGNKAVNGPLKLRNQANAAVEGNEGFVVDNTPWQPHKKK